VPQQFYLTADPAPYIPATWKGDWDKTSDAEDLLLDSTKTTADLTKYTIQVVSSSETHEPSAPGEIYRVALARFVSGPLLAQTISGTMQIMAGVVAVQAGGGTDTELYYALHIYATQGDTDDVRGTLLIDYSELAASNNPFPMTPKGRDMILSAALNAVTIEDDDRLVIEVGYAARNTTAVEIEGSLYYGTDYYSNGCPDMVRDI
jgi:hypothetical protein